MSRGRSLPDEEIRNHVVAEMSLIYKAFVLVAATIVVPLFLVFGCVITVGLMVSGFSVLIPVGYPFLGFLLCCTPVAFFLATVWLRSVISREAMIVRKVGAEEALWHVGSYVGGTFVTDCVWFFRRSTDSSTVPAAFIEGAWAEISVVWSKMILWLDNLLQSKHVLTLSLAISIVMWFRIAFHLALKWVYWLVWCWVAVACVIILSPAEVVTQLAQSLLVLVWYMTPVGWLHLRVRLVWLSLAVKAVIVDLTLLVAASAPGLQRHYSERLSGRRNFISIVFKQNVMKGVRLISAVRLPAFVRNRFKGAVGKEELATGRQILKDLGWPVNVDIVDEPVDRSAMDALPEYDDWLVSSTDFATGIRGLKTHINDGLKELAGLAPAFIRTEEYKNTVNELEATARYFQDRKVDFNVDVIDDLWSIVKPIFQNSRLSSFGDIIYLWEKKYALGFWMTTPDGRRKLSRRSFIAKVGMPRFKELWARTFVRASEILPVAHVSVKDEALSPVKFLANKVRSIIGSPISHYIGSTVFSNWANHNFQYDSTPIKIGMPLNGHWIGKVFDRHSRMDVHMEGDFTSFDSTIEGPVKELIRAVRKRGFQSHKDQRAIADLIDVMYDQLDKQFLGFTSTGNVYRKGSGLSTGHSSTSMDNSVATLVFYLAAWKQITGLSAREFLHFNEMSLYGDDHMLSVSVFAPRGWVASNIVKTMDKWGVINKLAVKKLKDISFLSKFSGKPNPLQREELNRAGLKHVNRCVWHDKEKLLGKLTAKVKKNDRTYRCQRLMSYLTLTAHHPEIYAAIHKSLQYEGFQAILKGEGRQVPTYEQVLQSWYAATPAKELPLEQDEDELWVEDGKMLVVGTPTFFDHLLQVLSVVPDLLNPSVFNHGPSRLIQSLLAPHLGWVPTLLVASNGIGAEANPGFYARKTPYFWLDTNIVTRPVHADSMTTLLVRHWLYCLYCHFRPALKPIRLFEFIVRKMANIGFIINAKVQVDLVNDFFPFDMVVVAAVLACVPNLGHIADWVGLLSLPDIPVWLDLLFNRMLVFLWSSVPANFGEVDPMLRALRNGDLPLLISAPTGVGKSTALVAHVHLSQVCPHRKLVLVEPRTLLATGLGSYLESSFGLNVSVATTGSEFDPSAKVWIMTPQSFLGHLHLMKRDDLFFIDEAHLTEPLVAMLVELLPKWKFKTICATATITPALEAKCGMTVSIPLAKIFDVTSQRRVIPGVESYLDEALQVANSHPRTVKVLVLVDTPEQAEKALGESHYPGQVLSSRHSVVIKDVPRYYATNVVDVGITIPGLDVMIAPAWEYGGASMRYSLSDSTLKQRMGRLGRTNNGNFILMVPERVDFPPAPSMTSKDAWLSAMAAGISPALGWQVDPDAMTDIFGLNKAQPIDVKQFSRVSHFFLTNFRALKSLELERDLNPQPTGRPVTLVPSWIHGTFSEVTQDLSGVHQMALNVLSKLLQKIQEAPSRPKVDVEELDDLPAGPALVVSNLVKGFLKNPDGYKPRLSDRYNPNDVPDFEGEFQKIMDILEEIKGA